MKGKVVLAALAVLACAAFSTATASEKKKKTVVKTVKLEPLTLTNGSDSLSYAAGMSQTDGLLPFLKNQFGVDEANIADVAEGFKNIMDKGNDPKLKAYAAGQQVAFMVMERFLPGMKEQLAGSADSVDVAKYTQGFYNALMKDNKIMADSTARKYFETTMKQVVEAHNAAQRKAGEDFLAANAKKEGVVTLPSGLQYEVITAGTGEPAGANDEVTVKYEGKLLDGTVFDSSYKRGDGTAKFRPNQVIEGWKEALTKMPAGSKWKLYVPQNLAYGERKAGQIPPFSTLIFTVEVVKIDKEEAKKTEAAPAAQTQKPAANKTKTNNKKK